jgi:hypothetical protein
MLMAYWNTTRLESVEHAYKTIAKRFSSMSFITLFWDSAPMPLQMPPGFPTTPFLKFGTLAGALFPPALSDEALWDPLERGRHFDRAWRAVRYRYRTCSDCNDDFRALLAGASALWRAWSEDEETNYQLERTIYGFFTNGLSVFESLGFALYFVGGMLRRDVFRHIGKPKGISLDATAKAFAEAFPRALITERLTALLQAKPHKEIDEVRNILAHRLSGMRNIRHTGTTHPDGTYEYERQELWHVPGRTVRLTFDADMLQRHLDGIATLLTELIEAALEFVQQHPPEATPA